MPENDPSAGSEEGGSPPKVTDPPQILMSSVHPGARAWIGLGSNLGEPVQKVEAGMAEIDNEPGIRVAAYSSLYRTAPTDYLDQPEFINAVVRINCTLEPAALLGRLQSIENRFGRDRYGVLFGPRTLDLDILIYDDLVLETGALTLPHPRMHQRLFVLEPLFEIEGEMVIPAVGKLTECRKNCAGQQVEVLPASESTPSG